MADKDHLSNEVSIEGRVTETGLSAKAKSRAIAAFDRLIGAALDVPGAKMEAWANRIRNQGRLESATYDAAVERIGATIDSETDAARLVDEVVASRIQAIANKKHVVKRAVELLALPSSDTQTAPESDAAEVDPDWLNYFDGYAEKATSENVRDLWARVLDGEIRSPGSFCRATLRLLAELDQQMASWFQLETEFRVEGEYILRPENLTSEQIYRLIFLEQVGLLQHVDPSSRMTRMFEPDSSKVAAAFEGDLCLRMQTDRPLKVKTILITRIGQEIAKILPPVDRMAVLKRLGEAVRNEVESMDIRRVLSIGQGSARVSDPIEVLKPAASDST